jgi:acyl carrier protein
MNAVRNLTVNGVAGIVIRLLAEERGESEEQTRAWLENAGHELPIDSLLIMEILTRVEEECGARIAADADAARSMRSVVRFAETVVTAARASSGGGGHDGYLKA